MPLLPRLYDTRAGSLIGGPFCSIASRAEVRIIVNMISWFISLEE